MSQQINTGLESYLKTQIAMAQRVVSVPQPKYMGDPYKYLCDTVARSLKTNPQTRTELNVFVNEAMRQLLSNNSLLQQNDIPTANSSFSFDDALNVAGKVNSAAGFYAGYRQYDLYIDAKWNGGVGKWKGNNGAWYAEKVAGKYDFLGNQYTGSRKSIIAEFDKYSKIGNKIFWIGTTISVAQGYSSLKQGNTRGAIKAGADIVVGVIATWGGPVGWAIGGVYLFLDLVGTFDEKCIPSGLSPYANNPYIHVRDNTYVKPPVMPPHPIRRIPSPPKPNAEFRQGYKKY